MNLRPSRVLAPLVLLGLSAACGSGLSSEDDAHRAYLGLDGAVEKALSLGMQGFRQASSANIPEQSTTGEETGTLTVRGQVDQGASANKGMRLSVQLVDYSDGPVIWVEDERELEVDIAYATHPDRPPALNLSLRDIPDGTLTGSLAGEFLMSGDLGGTVTLNLAFSGRIEDDGAGGPRRVAGSTTVTGTATASSGSTYAVNLTI